MERANEREREREIVRFKKKEKFEMSYELVRIFQFVI